jgi:RNA polymerase sigma-70 factor (ECF subfamily)
LEVECASVAAQRDLEEVYARYSRSVYRRALRLLGDAEAARDATQEVFVRVLRAGGDVPAEPTPTAWLYRVTTNFCLNQLRDRNRQEALLTANYLDADIAPAAAETRATIRQVLTRIPEDLHEVAIYFFVDELTYDEIAPLLQVSRRTVSNRLAAFRTLVAELSWETRSAS